MVSYPKTVLLATDGAEDSVRAARVAVSLSRSTGAELHVVHVGRPAPSAASGGSGGAPPLPGEPVGYAEKTARRMLEGQVEVVRSLGGEATGEHLRIGVPATEVISVANDLGADMIVVGSGGPKTVRRAVAATARRSTIGRASDAIVRGAPCPVLVVRGDIELEEI